MAWIKGKKTYIIAILIIAKAAVSILAGDLTWTAFLASPELDEILIGLGLGALRNGIG